MQPFQNTAILKKPEQNTQKQQKYPRKKLITNFEEIKNIDIFAFYKIRISLKKFRQSSSNDGMLFQWNYVIQCRKHFQDHSKRMLDFIFRDKLHAVQSFTGKTYSPLPIFKIGHHYKPDPPMPFKSVKQLCHIQFNNLIALNLNNHEIKSVQALSFLNAPKLRRLQLYNNFITNLNTLAKGNFPQLTVITFYQNPIRQIEKIYRINSKKLRRFQFDNKKTYQKRLEDYQFLFKMQGSLPKMLKIQDQNRINVRKSRCFKIFYQSGTIILDSQPTNQVMKYWR